MVKRDAADLIEMRARLHTLRRLRAARDSYRGDLAKMGLTEKQANYFLSEDPKAIEVFEKWLSRRRGQMAPKHPISSRNAPHMRGDLLKRSLALGGTLR
jgi:hypothetical protein